MRDKKIKVVIDRSKWRTGGDVRPSGWGDTELRNKNGFQCCLGFCVKAFDPKLPITGRAEPANLGVFIPSLASNFVSNWVAPSFTNTPLAIRAMAINDDPEISHRQREAKLLRLFKNSPYQLKFVGKYRNRDEN
jgi:hypothetical protein